MTRAEFAVTVDVACLRVRAGRLEIVVVRRANPPFQHAWALPGGFVEIDESPAEAAARELEEETGLTVTSPMLQCRAYGDPGRDPRGPNVSILHVAVTADGDGVSAASDAAGVAWVPVDEFGESASAFDHADMCRDAVAFVAARIEHTALATAMCPPQFSLAQLREVYEAVWDAHCDPTNFRRKVTAIPGFLRAAGEPRRAEGAAVASGRPAQYYERGPADELDLPFHRPRRP